MGFFFLLLCVCVCMCVCVSEYILPNIICLFSANTNYQTLFIFYKYVLTDTTGLLKNILTVTCLLSVNTYQMYSLLLVFYKFMLTATIFSL